MKTHQIAIIAAAAFAVYWFTRERQQQAPAGYEWRYSPWAGKDVLVPIGAVM